MIKPLVTPAVACVLAGLLLAFLSSDIVQGDRRDGPVQDVERVMNDVLRSRLEKLRAQPASACPTPPPSDAPQQHGGLPRPPDRVEVAGAPTDGKPARVQTLASLLDRATVLVLQGRVSGSGFFISPTHVLTNRHVVEGGSTIEVGNPAIGHLVAARVVALGTAAGTGRQDIALLETAVQDAVDPLRIGITPMRLTDVTAAGFPGVLLEAESRRDRLPEASFTQGVVASRQSLDPDGIETISHTALISGGNSGGPLVDDGGCVVGMNSWGTSDISGGVTHATYSEAIDASELRKFLRAEGTAFTPADTACSPIRTLGPRADATSR